MVETKLNRMKKNIFIETLKEGDRIEDVFQVKSTRLSETRAGKPYLILTLMDKSGDISGPVWDNAERYNNLCKVGTFVKITGIVQSFRDKPQLKVEAIEEIDQDEVELADFVATTNQDLETMASDIQILISSVKNPFIRKLLKKIFTGSTWEIFKAAPAAKGIHHAYMGGLLEHCLSIAKLAESVASHYPGVDRSLLIAGALLHDVGKLRELSAEVGVVDYTVEGRLKGHLVIGSEMVAEAAQTIKDFPAEILIQIQHLILSHHGRKEFGSPVVPMTVEAFLLNHIDEMDSKMNLMDQLRQKQKEEGMQWSDYQRSLERFLYLGPLVPDAETKEKGKSLVALQGNS
jgi:3'-5' exoribonuclease